MALGDGIKTAGELVRDADAAMYRAKALGRGRLQLFDAATQDEALIRVHTETALRDALARGELRLHFQPIVELVECRPVGVEALLRWEHPTRGLLAPDAFIAVAEDSGLIVPIGAWVLGEACRRVRAWNELLDEAHQLRVSVNLSARQLAEPELLATVRDTLLGAGIDPHHLELSLEITEALMLHDPSRAMEGRLLQRNPALLCLIVLAIVLLWIMVPPGLDGFFRETCSPPGEPRKELTREQINAIALKYGTEFR